MREGKKVVYVDGTFDLVHPGHIAFLNKCKKYGDYLIVGILNDKDVASYKRSPIIPLEGRALMLQYITLVDEVIAPAPFKGGIGKDFINNHEIDIVVYASLDGTGNNMWTEHYKEPIKMGIMHYEKYGNNHLSTTRIISKIRSTDIGLLA